ncbi:DUF6056 family protein [Hymenobacter koreensis]|uniref:Glycosyltransferase RgtA/B/C/D-like domain-containing protein n=1 Tax=Hymenobacter koreensis TaxID=1084523 RepID=A0ABP8JKZ1_9BACT
MRFALIHSRFIRSGVPALVGLMGILCLLPFVALCWYAHPSADDFLTANEVRKYGHWGYIPFMYLNWTGRYTSTVLWGLLNPVSYGNTTEGYGLVCLLLILALPVVLYVLLQALLPGQFRRFTLWVSSGVLTALFLVQMPSPAEGFYWITSTYNYLLPALLTLLALAALARRAAAATPAARRRWLVAAGVLAVLAIGGNETNALVLALGVGGFTALRSLQRRRIEWEYVGLSAAIALACAAAFLAPGNFARLDQSAHASSVLEAADKAALSAYRGLVNWLGNGVVLALTVLLLPVGFRLRNLPNLPLNQLAQNPLFITLLIPVSLILVQFLAWWATNQPMPARSRNVLYLFFLIGWFLNAYAWARYFWRNSTRGTLRLPGYAQAALIGWIVVVFALGHTRKMRGREPHDNLNNVLVAYQDWLNGAAARYDAQLTARYQVLKAKGWSSEHVVVEPLQDPPRTLLFGDITPDVNDWSNLAYAEFFGQKSIRVPAN